MAVSPDGQKLIFSERSGNYDIISVDLEHATASRLIDTELDEVMPAWSAKQPVITYVTNRNGRQEIWLRQGGADRPLVTGREFPDDTQWFLAPAISPDGARVIYSRTDSQGRTQAWISAVSGGAPVPLTSDPNTSENPGAWSPDGSQFTYLVFHNGGSDLMKVKTSGQATPVLVKSGVQSEVPSWSPAGNLLLAGNTLLSPDGAVVKELGDHGTQNYVFSADGKRLYGLRTEGMKELLFSVDTASGEEKTLGDIGREFAPHSNLHPAMRFSLSPDGKSFAYSTGTFKSNLWLLEGWAPKR